MMQNGWAREALDAESVATNFSELPKPTALETSRMNPATFFRRSGGDFARILPQTGVGREWNWFKKMLSIYYSKHFRAGK